MEENRNLAQDLAGARVFFFEVFGGRSSQEQCHFVQLAFSNSQMECETFASTIAEKNTRILGMLDFVK